MSKLQASVVSVPDWPLAPLDEHVKDARKYVDVIELLLPDRDAWERNFLVWSEDKSKITRLSITKMVYGPKFRGRKKR